jgi:hypothetical protein
VAARDDEVLRLTNLVRELERKHHQIEHDARKASLHGTNSPYARPPLRLLSPFCKF